MKTTTTEWQITTIYNALYIFFKWIIHVCIWKMCAQKLYHDPFKKNICSQTGYILKICA